MDLGFDPAVDHSVWNNTRLLRQGLYMNLPENEFAVCVHGIVFRTNSQVSYEKALRETEVWTHDPSDYTPGHEITRDAVGDDTRATIMPGNMTGRAWGHYSDAVVEPGADGLAIGKETCVVNHGPDQPQVDQINSKYAHLVASGGQNPATAAIYAIASRRYHLGFVMRSDAFPGHPDDAFLVLYREGTHDPLFRVNAKGEITHVEGRPILVRRINGFDCLTLG